MTKVKNRISSKQKNDILVKNIIVININDLIFGVSLFGFFMTNYERISRHEPWMVSNFITQKIKILEQFFQREKITLNV